MSHDYRYKVVYKSGKEFQVVTDLMPLDFVKQERDGSSGTVEKIFLQSDHNSSIWTQVFPRVDGGYY